MDGIGSALSAPGIGSGLDVSGMVTQLMAIERRPLAALDLKQQGYRAQLSAYGTLKSALAKLQSAATVLNTPSKFLSFKATSSDDKVFTASAGASAVAGNYSIEVTALAQAHQLTKSGFASSSEVLGAGAIHIELGSYGAGVFAANPDKTAKNITIDSGNNTLAGVRDAINAAGAGVSATIVNGVAGSQLFISANDTGLANSIRITLTDNDGANVDNAGLSRIAYDPSLAGGNVANLSQRQAALDAALNINGVAVASASNSVQGSLDGLKLNLVKTNLGTPITLAVTQDTPAVKSKIESFVHAYNEVHKALKDLTAFDPTSRVAGPLNGDSTARTVQGQLRAIFNSPISGPSGNVRQLADIGITFQGDGALAIDSTKLESALNDPGKNISELFVDAGGVSGYASQIHAKVEQMISSAGLVSGRTEGINDSIRGLDTRRERIEGRLQKVEQRLRAQFTALDAAITRMQSTSSFLQQQLSALNRNSAR